LLRTRLRASTSEIPSPAASRPTPAIETIAYFSVAELLVNVAKHSSASRAEVEVIGQNRRLRVRVIDDGVGGAALGMGSGLKGLDDRVRGIDGALSIQSPREGPTVVAVELPLRA
jgi:signal transduction histidine kinase